MSFLARCLCNRTYCNYPLPKTLRISYLRDRDSISTLRCNDLTPEVTASSSCLPKAVREILRVLFYSLWIERAESNFIMTEKEPFELSSPGSSHLENDSLDGSDQNDGALCIARLIECSQISMVRPLLVKERTENGFNASRTVILTSKTSMAFGGTISA
ncbi:hypothetical protein TNCV_4166681 [Trichonephila clavipes]|nr:hypothetical protein TNCV_4166681 [Trichonephila clavipes]